MKSVVVSIPEQAGNARAAIFGFPATKSLLRSFAENLFGLTTYDYHMTMKSTSDGSFRMFAAGGNGKFFLNTAVEGGKMAGELDPRLIGLLRASLGFIDALRDVGIEGEIAVRLDRAGARRLREVVDARGDGLKLAGLAFEWPKSESLQFFAENDNITLPLLEDETPALK